MCVMTPARPYVSPTRCQIVTAHTAGRGALLRAGLVGHAGASSSRRSTTR